MAVIKANDYKLIQDYLQERYQNISMEELLELTSETISFVSSHIPKDFLILTIEEMLQHKTLLKHLDEYRSREQLSYKKGRKVLSRTKIIRASDLSARSNSTVDDSWVTRVKRASETASDREAFETVFGKSEADQLSDYGEQLRIWKGRLPAIEFEAIERMTGRDSPARLTYGLTRHGLLKIFRRARFRMKWHQL